MKRFVILGSQQGGTHLLSSYLNSHKYIEVLSEVFLSEGNRTEEYFKKVLKAKSQTTRSVGCIVHFNQIPEWFVGYCKKHRIKLVLVTRAVDIDFLAWVDGHYNYDTNGDVVLNTRDIVDYGLFISHWYQKLRKSVQYKLPFERLLPNNEGIWGDFEVRRPFLRWLGVVDKKLKTTIKLPLHPAAATVSVNYLPTYQALRKALANIYNHT